MIHEENGYMHDVRASGVRIADEFRLNVIHTAIRDTERIADARMETIADTSPNTATNKKKISFRFYISVSLSLSLCLLVYFFTRS